MTADLVYLANLPNLSVKSKKFFVFIRLSNLSQLTSPALALVQKKQVFEKKIVFYN